MQEDGTTTATPLVSETHGAKLQLQLVGPESE